MCTSIVEIVRAEGMAKREDAWFPLTQAVVAYDHARHAPLADVVTLDFINTELEPGARAGIELTLETAKELRAALPGDHRRRVRGGGVRGKGATPASFRQRDPKPWGQTHCMECGDEIPQARRRALSGVRTCIICQSAYDRRASSRIQHRPRGATDISPPPALAQPT